MTLLPVPDSGSQDPAASICTVLGEALERPGSRSLYVLPSTRETIEWASRWRRSAAHPLVVAPSVPGMHSPTQLLEKIQSEKGPLVAAVFSDQLTSAANSPMLVARDGISIYLSALEIVAHCNYRCEVNVWVGGIFEKAPPDGESMEILLLLYRYLSACNALGARWSMRDFQSERHPQARISDARLRLRTFHSALMHAFVDSPLPPRYRAVLEQIQTMQKSLRLQASA